MKQLFMVLCVLLLSATVNAQLHVKKDASGNFTTYTRAADTTKAATGQTVTIKDTAYPVYKSVNGKFYIIRTSNKTGNQYKQYLKVD